MSCWNYIYSEYVIVRLKILLAYGLDFHLPVYKIDFYKYFLAYESLIARMKSLGLDKTINYIDFIKELQTISFKYFYNFKSYKIFSAVFTKEDITELKQLSSNKEIIVCKPDKGRGVVLINKKKKTYLSKMLEQISDRAKYEEICESIFKYTLRIEDKINNFLRKLKKSSILSENVFRSLLSTGTAPGILYGLPKIHKPDFSTKFQFRPIFAAYNCPSFKIAKYLVPILSLLTTNDFTLENSYSFGNALTVSNLSSKCFMASYDVSNLFTNMILMKPSPLS